MNLFAFWSYGSYPYVLGGTVTRMREDGYVETKEYGPGAWFKPVKLLPLDAGKELNAKLRALDANYTKSLAAFQAGWNDEAKRLFEKG